MKLKFKFISDVILILILIFFDQYSLNIVYNINIY